MNHEDIAKFIQSLHDADLKMTAEDIADTLWLALQMAEKDEVPFTSLPHDPLPLITTKPPEPSLPYEFPSHHPEPENTTEARGEVYLPTRKQSTEHKTHRGGKSARMPAAPALRGFLPLGRALRPLRRRGISRKGFVLNEQATAHRIAEMKKRLWLPVLEHAPVRYFDLALVIDQSASMIFWQQTIAELRTHLERLGAFRDIRVWQMTTDEEDSVRLYAGARPITAEQPIHNPRELIDPTRRRLIIVITDCISPAWYSGKVQEVLEIWGRKNLVTLLQMLPQRLWPRTALCASEAVEISATAPGTANIRLKMPVFQMRTANKLAIPIPVVTLDRGVLTPWVRMALGIESAKVAGIIFPDNLRSIFAAAVPGQNEDEAFSPQLRVQDFQAAAPPAARKLARLLTATPVITLPIVHVIQQTMLSESEASQVHVAEVFLGGLLREVARNGTTVQPEYIEYEFLPGIKEELERALPRPDKYQVLREVSAFMENRLGFSHSFLGLVATPNLSEDFSISEESRPFAKILARVWRRLGGEYNQLADLLEQRLDGHSSGTDTIVTPITTSTTEYKEEVRIETFLSPLFMAADRKGKQSTSVVCPSCFKEIYPGNCRIVIGDTGKVVRDVPAPRDWFNLGRTRNNPEKITLQQYIQESRQRECTNCGYRLPYNIERVDHNITFAVVGDVFSGKSHYIASLVHQLKENWINALNEQTDLMCLTPGVEEAFIKDQLNTVFGKKHILPVTAPSVDERADPLIYHLAVSISPQRPPTSANLMIYNASGEDFREERLVQFARFVFNKGAFVFVADPVMIPSIFDQLPLFLQANIQKTLGPIVRRRAADVLSTTLSLFERYHGYPEGSALKETPVAVMLSKADLLKYDPRINHYTFTKKPPPSTDFSLEDIDEVDLEVRDFLRHYQQGDLIAATHGLKQVKFFAASATGEPPDENGNFRHIGPYRCLDPVFWILYRFGIIEAKL
ncbi:hypothetical protein KSF_065410 [Reticulibacter mediterranei]|uniref:Uncharacterized protein n=1 Tax=Reticulibacter mediterranei TaxID=2778369 RepID=A0A8J3IPZ8_9CHLR|nr:SAV_2336 N-terminal domain-related protein [Reticulibacter mediterranei]GHO96493.1 hypothetical protein KSF_065410 [Reticulibacter mediterranei]